MTAKGTSRFQLALPFRPTAQVDTISPNLGNGMRRRLLIAGLGTLGTLAKPTLTRAQQAQKMPLIGFLHPGFPETTAPTFTALADGLRDSGYIEGKNVNVEARWGVGKPETLVQFARELVQLRAAVLVATARPSIEAARAATT